VLGLGLAGAAGATVMTTAGCGLRWGSPSSAPARTTSPQLSTDERALGAALRQADDLAALYARAVVARPDLADALRLLGSDHTAHVRTLQPLSGTAASAMGSTTPMSSTTSSASPTPLTAVTAVSMLAQAERSATAAALAVLATVSGPAARLLASVAACDSAHVGVLAGLPTAPKTAQ
jgi:hypothetical protein